MKKRVLNVLLFVSITFAATSCKEEAKTVETEAAKTVETVITENNYTAVAAESMISWKANKIVGGHEGTINLAKGKANTKGDALVGGTFIFDINTLKCTDIPAEDESNAKLVGHLLSPDFFNAEQFSNASFEITKVDGNNVSGNLTIKGITKNVTFPASVSTDGDILSISSEMFTIDRTEWDIKYNSGKFADPAKLGDYLIKDDIEIKVSVKAQKA